MASRAVKILTALQGRLQRIKRSNGYNSDVGRVDFGVVTPDAVTSDCQLAINAGNLPLNPLTNDCYTTGPPDGKTGGWPVIVIGYERHKTDAGKDREARLALFDLHADVVKAINEDRRLGTDPGLIDDITLGEAVIFWDAFEGLSYFMIMLEVVYSFESTDP